MTTAQRNRQTLADAIARKPVMFPAADPHCWSVMSRTTYGMWHEVRPGTCSCEAAAHNRKCWAYLLVAAVERGIVNPATMEVTWPAGLS